MAHGARKLTTVEGATSGHNANLREKEGAEATEDCLGVVEDGVETDNSNN